MALSLTVESSRSPKHVNSGIDDTDTEGKDAGRRREGSGADARHRLGAATK